MIAGVKGKLFQKEENRVLIETNGGVIYEILVSLNTLSKIEDEVLLFVTEIIREDSYLLYGFIDKNEKRMFDSLIKVNGVGAKVALAICSTFTPFEFSRVVKNREVKELKKVAGVGPKGANRILMELGEFEVDTLAESGEKEFISEAITALEGLGFKRDDIVEVVKELKASSTEELIKKALKQLASI